MRTITRVKGATAFIVMFSFYMAAEAIISNYKIEKELKELREIKAQVQIIPEAHNDKPTRAEALATVKQSLTVPTKETTEEPPEDLTPVEATFTAHDEIPLDAEIQEHIETECERLGVDAAYIYALIESESSFRTGLLVEDGGGHSAGLCQINSVNWPTMRELGLDPMDELDNITFCITLVKGYIDKYPTIDHVTTCYKAGEGGAKRLNYHLSVCDEINARTEYYTTILKGGKENGED